MSRRGAAATPSLARERRALQLLKASLMKALPSPLLVITDRHQARHCIETIAEAVGKAGGRWLLLRDKDLTPDPENMAGLRLCFSRCSREE